MFLGNMYYNCPRCGQAHEHNATEEFWHDRRYWGWRVAFRNLWFRLTG